jgi:hypothetical protein
MDIDPNKCLCIAPSTQKQCGTTPSRQPGNNPQFCWRHQEGEKRVKQAKQAKQAKQVRQANETPQKIKEMIVNGNDVKFIDQIIREHRQFYETTGHNYSYGLIEYKHSSSAIRPEVSKAVTGVSQQTKEKILSSLDQFFQIVPPLSNWLYVCHGYGLPYLVKGKQLSETHENDIITTLRESYISTSVMCGAACSFARLHPFYWVQYPQIKEKILLHLFLPPGTKGFYIDGVGVIPDMKGEDEFLLPRGMTFRIIKIDAHDKVSCQWEVYSVYAVAII